jgi:cytochrome P450
MIVARHNLPTGPDLPSVAQLALYAADPLGTLSRWADRHGHTFTARFAGVGNFVFTREPDLIRAIFAADPKLLEAGPQNLGLRPVVGPASLLTLDGVGHARHRRILMPLFQADRLRRAIDAIRRTTLASIDRWPIGRTFQLQPHLADLTLDVILEFVLGPRPDLADWRARFARLLHASSSPIAPMLTYWGVDLLRAAPFLPAARAKADLDAALFAEIARIRREGGSDSDGALGLLLAARDEQSAALDNGEVRDELVSLIVAGNETVAGALAWTIDQLLASPDATARIRDEIGDATVDAALLERTPFLDAALKESLRLHPVLALVARRARRPFSLGGFDLPAGTWLAPSIFLTHRRADLYPDPEVFRPERFLGKRPDPGQWIPFGGGGRRCIGMGFSLLELKTIVATILQRRRLRSRATSPTRIQRRSITLVPSGDLPVLSDLAS